jgi:hypothetical protein
MMHSKGLKASGRSLILKYYPGIRFGGTEENHKNAEQPVSAPRFEPGTSSIREKDVERSGSGLVLRYCPDILSRSRESE